MSLRQSNQNMYAFLQHAPDMHLTNVKESVRSPGQLEKIGPVHLLYTVLGELHLFAVCFCNVTRNSGFGHDTLDMKCLLTPKIHTASLSLRHITITR